MGPLVAKSTFLSPREVPSQLCGALHLVVCLYLFPNH